MLRIACGVARRGMEVHAAFPRADGTESMIRDCEAAGVSYWPLDWKPLSSGRILPRTLPMEIRAVPRILKLWNLLNAVRPDVVQITAAWPTEVSIPSLACALYQVPTLAVFQLAPKFELFSELQLKALSWARRRRQRWMAVSRHNLPFLESTFRTQPGEIGILTNGIEITEAPSKATTESLRRDVRIELGLPASAKILLTTARLETSKGHTDLLEIAPMVLDRFPDVVFILAGDGSNRTYFLRTSKADARHQSAKPW
jgi:glycosyltransferase involved in cell wall biosynthesis